MSLFKSKYDNFDMDGFVKELRYILTKNTIIVNIGTDRCIGDAMAPLIGTLLRENNFRFPVYGTIESPIHAVNIETRLKDINNLHPNANIIGIDACLGDSVDNILINDYPIRPGSGLGKSLPSVGKFSIVGVVNNDGDTLFNNSIRFDKVFNMAKKITEGLIKASQYIEANEVASDSLDNEIKLFKVS